MPVRLSCESPGQYLRDNPVIVCLKAKPRHLRDSEQIE